MKHANRLLIMMSLMLITCSRSHSDRRDRNQDAPRPDLPVADGEGMVDIPLLELPASGSQLRFLDAFALTDVYSRIFIRDTNGRWKGCGNDASWCQKSMFSKDEAKFLGTFSLLDAVDSFRVKKDFSLNYTRTLRAALFRECRNLVEIEWQRFTAPADPQQNVLVFRQGVPEANDLDLFSRRMFGLQGTDISLDTGASEYQAAFKTAIGSRKDAATLKSGYVVTCMALAMDPSVFLY